MWQEVEDSLFVELEFNDFVEAFEFMSKVAELAESQQHHPNWSNVYNKVSISLTTHDAGNVVTQKDRDLAAMISDIPGFSEAVR